MLEDICRVIQKGHDDTKVNFKILEAARNNHMETLRKIEVEYNELLEQLKDTEDVNEVIVLEALQVEMEENNSWLTLPLDDFGRPAYPELDFDLTQWRIDNYAELRKAAYESKNQFELQFDGVWEEFVNSVKLRFPKG